METDLTNVRRWLFEDFKARAVELIPALLAANPDMGAFELIVAIEQCEAPIPVNAQRKAFLLDQYLAIRWVNEIERTRPQTRRPRKTSREGVKILL